MFNKKRIFVFVVFLLLLFFMMTFGSGVEYNQAIATRTVTFIDGFDNSTYDTVTVEVGTDANVPKNPYHRGYIFAGWYDYENQTILVTNFKNVLNDFKVIARYWLDANNNGIRDDRENLNQALVDNNQPENENNEPIDETTDLENTDDDNQEIDNVDDNQDTDNIDIDNLVNFYTVDFVDGLDNKIINSVVVREGNDATLPTAPHHNGYLFIRWNGENKNVTDDRIIIAIYEDDKNNNGISDQDEAKLHVTYKAGIADGIVPVDSKDYLDGDFYTVLSANNLFKEGYIFIGWSEDETKVSKSIEDEEKLIEPGTIRIIKKDVILTATFAKDQNDNKIPDYKENHYKVEFKANGNGKLNGNLIYENILTDLTFEQAGISVPETEADKYYEFKNWTPIIPTEKMIVDGDLVFVANFGPVHDNDEDEIADEEQLHVLTVKYVYKHDTNLDAQDEIVKSLAYNEEYSILSPENDYTGYYHPEVEMVKGTMGYEDIEQLVMYVPNNDQNENDIADEEETYKLTVNYVYSNGNIASETIKKDVVYNTNYEVVSPKILYYLPSAEVISGTMPHEDITKTVVYTPINDQNENGVADEEETVMINFQYLKDGMGTQKETVITEKVAYVYDSVNNVYPILKTSDIPSDVNIEGYTFKGWTKDGKTIVSPLIADGNITFIASYSINTYTVTFMNENEVYAIKNYKYGEIVVTPTNPHKQADKINTYEFVGWDDFIEKIAKRDMIYNAVYESTKIEYTVKFVDYDGSEISTSTYNYGEVVNIPADPERATDKINTYEFIGWSPVITNVEEDVTYKATYKETKIEYTVEFIDWDETIISSCVYNYGDTVEIPSDPKRKSDKVYIYSFKGWSPVIANVEGNATYQATYESTKIEYTVKFVDYDGSEISTSTYNYGEIINIPADPERATDKINTYEFIGWSPVITNVEEDVTYKATYKETKIEYTVKFVDYDGSEISTSTYNYGEVVNIPADPERATDKINTYEFIGWSPVITNVEEDVTYQATYESTKIEYTVKFVDYDGSEISTSTYNYGEVINIPADPERATDKVNTYEFIGWSPVITNVEEDVTYKATYKETKIEYTVKFVDWDERVILSNKYNYGDLIVTPANPNRLNTQEYTYKFVGWDKEYKTVTGDLTIKAVYSSTINEYTVEFVSDGTVISSMKYAYGSDVLVPANPMKEEDHGYTYEFKSWSPDVTVVTNDVIYQAEYNSIPKKYTVTYKYYDAKGNWQTVDKEYDYGTLGSDFDDPVVPSVVVISDTQSKTFAGWSGRPNKLTDNVTITATYKNQTSTATKTDLFVQLPDYTFPTQIPYNLEAGTYTGLMDGSVQKSVSIILKDSDNAELNTLLESLRKNDAECKSNERCAYTSSSNGAKQYILAYGWNEIKKYLSSNTISEIDNLYANVTGYGSNKKAKIASNGQYKVVWQVLKFNYGYSPYNLSEWKLDGYLIDKNAVTTKTNSSINLKSTSFSFSSLNLKDEVIEQKTEVTEEIEVKKEVKKEPEIINEKITEVKEEVVLKDDNKIEEEKLDNIETTVEEKSYEIPIIEQEEEIIIKEEEIIEEELEYDVTETVEIEEKNIEEDVKDEIAEQN